MKISAHGDYLDPWQTQVLDSKKKSMILNCARQVGKSTVVAIKALHAAIYTPNYLALLTSPSLRQSQELFKKVAYYTRQVADLPDKTEDNQLSLMFSNGSRIVALPGTAKTIRGYSADLVIVDEAAYTDPSLFPALGPMLSITNGDLMLLSTPNGKVGFFWDVWDRGEPEEWDKFEIPWWRCPRHSETRLKSQKRVLGEYRFRVEYECQFLDPEDAVFSYEDLEAAFGMPIDGLNIDIGEGVLVDNDLEVITI